MNHSDQPEALPGLDVPHVQRMLAEGRITSAEFVRDCLARIEAYDQDHGSRPGLHAVVAVNEDALADAEALDAARAAGRVLGPLHGIPVLVKEVFNVKGMPTTAGLGSLLKRLVAPADATVIGKLRHAGAIILAHTDAGSTDSANPFDHSKSPGGSSSGNGAGLAASYAPVAIGECTMGSTRIPAAWTSTVGFRPTTGLVSMNGVAPMSWSYDTPGPMATTVEDIALLMDVIAGFDPEYPTSKKINIPRTYAEYLDNSYLNDKKIGIYEPFMRASDTAISDVARAAAADMEALGARVVSLDEEVTFEVERTPPGGELLWEVAGSRGLNHNAGFDKGSELWPARNLWLAGFDGWP